MHDLLWSLLQQGAGVLVQLAIAVAMILLTSFKRHLKNNLLAHTTTQQRQLLALLGREAFAFAETVYREYDGPAKLNQATQYLLDKGAKLGLGEISLTDARAVIESAWLQDQRLLQAGAAESPAPEATQR